MATTTTSTTTTHNDSGFLQRLALPLRIVQFIFAIIVLGTAGYVAHVFNTTYFYGGYHFNSPSRVNFLIFCAVWTLLVLIYLILVPLRFASHPAGHKFAILAVEAVTMIFWFAGFIALAVYITGPGTDDNRLGRTAIAAVVFGAFEWLLFAVTTAFATMHVLRTRGRGGTTKADPNIRVQEGV